ncbi:hypothetical protein [Corynebacterium sp.]|nr:hypothetical protein [Corynebacterium sp.]
MDTSKLSHAVPAAVAMAALLTASLAPGEARALASGGSSDVVTAED